MKSSETKRLVHDLSREFNLEYYTRNYDKNFLLSELKMLVEHSAYIYKPARLILLELEKLNEKK
jgi:hypothetical protein